MRGSILTDRVPDFPYTLPYSLCMRSSVHCMSCVMPVVHTLSCNPAAGAHVQVIIPKLLCDKDLDTSITRADFERLCGDLFDQCTALAERLLQCVPVRLPGLGETSCFRPCTPIVNSLNHHDMPHEPSLACLPPSLRCFRL